MFKFLGAIIIFTACTSFGLIKSYKMKKRCDSLSTLLLSLRRICAETSFTKKRIERIFCEISREFNLPIFFLAASLIKTEGVRGAWEKSINEYSAEMCLSPRDVSAALTLGNAADFSGEEQQKSLRTCERLLELSLAEAKDDYQRGAKLSRSGGILCGILAVILLL